MAKYIKNYLTVSAATEATDILSPNVTYIQDREKLLMTDMGDDKELEIVLDGSGNPQIQEKVVGPNYFYLEGAEGNTITMTPESVFKYTGERCVAENIEYSTDAKVWHGFSELAHSAETTYDLSNKTISESIALMPSVLLVKIDKTTYEDIIGQGYKFYVMVNDMDSSMLMVDYAILTPVGEDNNGNYYIACETGIDTICQSSWCDCYFGCGVNVQSFICEGFTCIDEGKMPWINFIDIEGRFMGVHMFSYELERDVFKAGSKYTKVGWLYDNITSQKIYLRATNNACLGLNTCPFNISGNFNVGGNIQSLLDYEDLDNKVLGGSLSGMFSSMNNLINANKLVLPYTTLTNNCYKSMFSNCTTLITAPELPATTLTSQCYFNMFNGCTSLTTAPSILPATTLAENCYQYMFNGCTSLTTAPSILPATALTEWCYSGMFEGCSSLVNAPALPATTLAHSCYYGMFYGCTSLVNAPTLPATTLAENCYCIMFSGTNVLPDCTNIDFSSQNIVASGGLRGLFSGTKVTDNDLRSILPINPDTNKYWLPATILAENCYEHMFSDCISLQNAPELPATTLPWNCYTSMFRGCTSLVNAPALPATTLTYACYQYMFNGCTSLVNAPALPATTLAEYCYDHMFSDCISLQNVPELSATTLAWACYQYMFNGCTSLVNAPALPVTTLADDCYQGMFYGCTSLTSAPVLPATALADNCYFAMFYGCTSLNYIKCLAIDISANYCTTDWVGGVASTGTFVKASSMASWPTGSEGIPEGWTVVSE